MKKRVPGWTRVQTRRYLSYAAGSKYPFVTHTPSAALFVVGNDGKPEAFFWYMLFLFLFFSFFFVSFYLG